MGQVYRARDTKLNRDVALKVLPDSFANDPERLARFTREARTLASLNHQNIAHIHGLEESAGVRALVMELVEGEDLSQRIGRGALPIDEALAIAMQIADALEAAHEQNIIHRDLKPANIMVRADGTVKVLDFGLAKALEPAGVMSTSHSKSPTITTPAHLRQGYGGQAMTQVGMILGTAAYMSPEQARGRPVDKRADIWAFGCVFYEMLTGKRAFDGEDVSDTFAAVLRAEPDWAALPTETPTAIRRLLRRSLARERRARLGDVADARLEIEEASREERVSAAAALPPSRRREYVWAGIATVMLAIVGLGVSTSFRQAPNVRDIVRFDVRPPEGVTSISSARLSPDGRLLAFVATSDGRRRLWLRPLVAAAAQIMQGTDGIDSDFFWSPDSGQIGFSAEGQLKIVAAAEGGSPRVLTTLPGGATYTGTWGANGDILLGVTNTATELSGALRETKQAAATVLLRVSADGGQPVPASASDVSLQEQFHTFPHFLPDGRHYFFLAGGREGAAYVGTLDSNKRVALPGIASVVAYSPSGHVIFIRDGTLLAQPFDPDRLELSGQPVAIVDSFVRPGVRTGSFSVSMSGALTHSLAGQGLSRLVWFDRSGKELGIAAPTAVYVNPELSKDDRYVAWDEGPFLSSDIRVRDLVRGLTTRFTSIPGPDGIPQWSPDGSTIIFLADRGDLYRLGFGVVGDPFLLLKSDAPKIPTDWSIDGRYLAYDSSNDVWLLQLSDRKPLQVTNTPFAETDGRISPDGRWIAYQSNEAGVNRPVDVYLQSLSGSGSKVQVSTLGGSVPRWRRDGKELYYLAPDRMLMVVSVNLDGNRPRIGVPTPLFQTRVGRFMNRTYAVSRDGRFLVNTQVDDVTVATTRVVLNWTEELKRLVPAK